MRMTECKEKMFLLRKRLNLTSFSSPVQMRFSNKGRTGRVKKKFLQKRMSQTVLRFPKVPRPAIKVKYLNMNANISHKNPQINVGRLERQLNICIKQK